MMQPVAGLALGATLYAAAAGRWPRPRRPEAHERRVLAAAMTTAALEELLWRGAALRLLRRRGPGFALAATSVAFAAAHLPRSRGRAVATHAALAAVLGAVSLAPGGLAVAVLAHATYDALVLLEERPP